MSDLLDDLRDETGLDLGPAADVDAMDGPDRGGDVCPLCGDALTYTETVVRARDGATGRVLDLATDDVSIVLFCEDCWRDVEAAVAAVQNHALQEFAGDGTGTGTGGGGG